MWFVVVFVADSIYIFFLGIFGKSVEVAVLFIGTCVFLAVVLPLNLIFW